MLQALGPLTVGDLMAPDPLASPRHDNRPVLEQVGNGQRREAYAVAADGRLDGWCPYARPPASRGRPAIAPLSSDVMLAATGSPPRAHRPALDALPALQAGRRRRGHVGRAHRRDAHRRRRRTRFRAEQSRVARTEPPAGLGLGDLDHRVVAMAVCLARSTTPPTSSSRPGRPSTSRTTSGSRACPRTPSTAGTPRLRAPHLPSALSSGWPRSGLIARSSRCRRWTTSRPTRSSLPAEPPARRCRGAQARASTCRSRGRGRGRPGGAGDPGLRRAQARRHHRRHRRTPHPAGHRRPPCHPGTQAGHDVPDHRPAGRPGAHAPRAECGCAADRAGGGRHRRVPRDAGLRHHCRSRSTSRSGRHRGPSPASPTRWWWPICSSPATSAGTGRSQPPAPSTYRAPSVRSGHREKAHGARDKLATVFVVPARGTDVEVPGLAVHA